MMERIIGIKLEYDTTLYTTATSQPALSARRLSNQLRGKAIKTKDVSKKYFFLIFRTSEMWVSLFLNNIVQMQPDIHQKRI